MGPVVPTAPLRSVPAPGVGSYVGSCARSCGETPTWPRAPAVRTQHTHSPKEKVPMEYETGRRRKIPMLVGAVILALSSAVGGLVMHAHDQRETLIAADRGKAHGIETYRVWQNG